MSKSIDKMTEQEQMQYLSDKLRDPIWRLTSGVLYHIKDKHGNIIPFVPNKAQKELIMNKSERNCILKSRQIGFSTLIQIMALDTALFNANMNVAIIADTESNAKTLFNEKVKVALDNLPDWLGCEFEDREVDSKTEIKFINKSIISVGVSFRGGTVNFLHISEYGKICAKYPEKGREILTGAIEAVPVSGEIYIESTAEGAAGSFYDICKAAKDLQDEGRELTKLDYKFHFFPWWQDPTGILDQEVIITQELAKYFSQLEDMEGIELSPDQKAFYVKKKELIKDDMGREYPSRWEEAFELAVEGAYFKKNMEQVRMGGRLTKVPHDPNSPVYVARDLGGFGGGDDMALRFYQKDGQRINFIDYSATSGYSMQEHWNFVVVPKGYNIIEDWFPHDGKRTESNGKSVSENAYDLGIPVKQMEIGSISDGINTCRNLFHRCWFDEEMCAEGIRCLDNYARKLDARTGIFLDTPRKPHRSTHGADAFRYALVSYKEPAGSRPPIQNTRRSIDPITGRDRKQVAGRKRIDPITGKRT